MNKTVLILIMLVFALGRESRVVSAQPSGYTGSAPCKESHEKFRELWATSRHGLAMQPYTSAFAQKDLTPRKRDIVIGKYKYRADIGPKAGYVSETGPKGTKTYRIVHVTGGKNV